MYVINYNYLFLFIYIYFLQFFPRTILFILNRISLGMTRDVIYYLF